MLLIYTQKTSPRVLYVFKQICRRILGLEIDFVTKLEDFISYDGPKLSYGKQPLGKELYFQSVDLLFEYGIADVSIEVLSWEDTKCFFEVKNPEAALPFDIFAASFYLLSRYEEYLPHVKDEYGRYIATESLAHANGFLRQPVIDIWAYKFKAVLLKRFPNLNFIERSFTVRPIVIVHQTFAFKKKGILRSWGGSLRDLYRLKFRLVSDRIKVVSGFKKDPYDTFDYIIDFQKKIDKQLVVLFGLGDYSKFEKNISVNKEEHRSLIKSVADYTAVGLKVSFDAIKQMDVLKIEKRRLESVVNRILRYTICSFYKISLPTAYRNFVELEVEEDFSMGYPNQFGFRAGTCTSFLFYDLDYEVQTPLLIHSFSYTNQVVNEKEGLENAKQEIIDFVENIKKVNGTFIPIFSNGLFSELNNKEFWKPMFEFIWNLDEH